MTTENSNSAYRPWMRLLRRMMLACTSALTIISCQNESVPSPDIFDTPLVISANVGGYPGRSVVTGNTLANGASIGVTVVDAGDSDYQKQNYNNVCYTASVGTGGSQQWSTTTPIMLSGEAGTLYAYYPYKPDIDIENIGINLMDNEVVDWMYATKISNLSNDNSHAQIKLNHALAKLKVSLVKGNFVGTGKVTNISLTSGSAAMGATLNAKTGKLSNLTSTGTKLNYSINETLGDEPVELNLLFVPTNQTATVKIDVVVDNRHYTATADGTITSESGQSYNYTLIQNSTKVEISQVTVMPWTDNPQGTLESEKVK